MTSSEVYNGLQPMSPKRVMKARGRQYLAPVQPQAIVSCCDSPLTHRPLGGRIVPIRPWGGPPVPVAEVGFRQREPEHLPLQGRAQRAHEMEPCPVGFVVKSFRSSKSGSETFRPTLKRRRSALLRALAPPTTPTDARGAVTRTRGLRT